MMRAQRQMKENNPQWRTEEMPVAYDAALAFMEAKAAAIRTGGEPGLVWLLEHPPLYTAGTSAAPKDLLDPLFPVHQTGRGGQYTYHGPGQRVAYVMLDLQPRGSDLRKYIHDLEEWVIAALRDFGVRGERRDGRIGVWIKEGNSEAKISAIGVRVRKWVAYHGVSINVNPDLSHYGGIVPCGMKEYGVTSLQRLGVRASLQDVDEALRRSWEKVFS